MHNYRYTSILLILVGNTLIQGCRNGDRTQPNEKITPVEILNTQPAIPKPPAVSLLTETATIKPTTITKPPKKAMGPATVMGSSAIANIRAKTIPPTVTTTPTVVAIPQVLSDAQSILQAISKMDKTAFEKYNAVDIEQILTLDVLTDYIKNKKPVTILAAFNFIKSNMTMSMEFVNRFDNARKKPDTQQKEGALDREICAYKQSFANEIAAPLLQAIQEKNIEALKKHDIKQLLTPDVLTEYMKNKSRETILDDLNFIADNIEAPIEFLNQCDKALNALDVADAEKDKLRLEIKKQIGAHQPNGNSDHINHTPTTDSQIITPNP